MKKFNIATKDLLAVFVVVYGLEAIVNGNVSDMAMGALIGFVTGIIGYYFGSSTGNSAKDKLISEMNSNKENDPTPEPDPEIGGGGIKNPKP